MRLAMVLGYAVVEIAAFALAIHLLGFGWAVLNPLLLLAIYTFVFSVVFRIRWDGPATDRIGFALVVYAGMIVHGFFAECMTRAPQLVVDNRNLVKKVVFPLEILPWSTLVVAGFHLLIGLGLIALAVLVRNGGLPASAWALVGVNAPTTAQKTALTQTRATTRRM